MPCRSLNVRTLHKFDITRAFRRGFAHALVSGLTLMFTTMALAQVDFVEISPDARKVTDWNPIDIQQPENTDAARYRVEVIVFRHTNTLTEPIEITRLNLWRNAFELGQSAPGEVPFATQSPSGTFNSLWQRLSRLENYEPLTRLTFEQTQFDYHPAVRLHNDEVIGTRVQFPGDVIFLNLNQGRLGDGNQDLLARYRAPAYRLDGTIRLRRSRFLHIDVDLEYRLDTPPADTSDPLFMAANVGEPLPDRDTALAELQQDPNDLTEKAEDQMAEQRRPGSPINASDPTILLADGSELQAMTDGNVIVAKTIPERSGVIETLEPMRVHRIQQSRQIQTNTLQYFDTAYLSVLVRVSPVERIQPDSP